MQHEPSVFISLLREDCGDQSGDKGMIGYKHCESGSDRISTFCIKHDEELNDNKYLLES